MKFEVYSELDDAIERDIDRGHEIGHALDAGDSVSEACKLFWPENDGWEWMRNGCTLYAVDAAGAITKHEVGPPDFEPDFYADDGELVTPPTPKGET